MSISVPVDRGRGDARAPLRLDAESWPGPTGLTTYAITRRPGYPSRVFEFGDATVLLDGRMYGKSPAEVEARCRELRDVIGTPLKVEWLSRWVDETDGDFVIAVLDLDNRSTFVVTDHLSRLPAYWAEHDGRLLVTREPGRLLGQLGTVELEPMALAEYLALGYNTGSQTVYRGVRRIPPSSVLMCTPDRRPTVVNCSTLCFEASATGLSRSQALDRMTDLFVEATRTRATGSPIVAMSGGLDSRAVAAAMHAQGGPVRAATYLDSRGAAATDVRYASEVAKHLGLDWSVHRLEAPGRGDYEDLFDWKRGLNYLAMGYLLPFLRHVRAATGESGVHLTGDGGDKLLPSVRPAVHMETPNELLREIVRRQALLPLPLAAVLARVPAEALRAKLSAHLEGYPEARMDDRYLRFLITQRAVRLNFEGEDRNRWVLWSTTPFYSPAFTRLAVSLPEAWKLYLEFYADFLNRLADGVAGIPRPNLHLPITSKRHAMLRRLQAQLDRTPKLMQRVAAVRSSRGRRRHADVALAQAIDEAVVRRSEIDAILDTAAVRSLVYSDRISRATLFHVATAVAMASASVREESDADVLPAVWVAPRGGGSA